MKKIIIKMLQKQLNFIPKLYSKFSIFLATMLLTIACTGAKNDQAKDPKVLVGEKVGNLVFEKILNYEKESAKLSDYKDKIIILDFWGTFCGSCIAAFPHLEKLEKKYPDDLVVFTICRDSDERLKKFLEKSDMGLPIVLDRSMDLYNVFPHKSISHTILIDKDRTVKAICNPKKIKVSHIDALLNGKEINIELKDDFAPKPEQAIKYLSPDSAIFQMTLQAYQPHLGQMTTLLYNNKMIQINNWLPCIYWHATGMDYDHTILVKDGQEYTIYEAWKKDFHMDNKYLYCFQVIAPLEMDTKELNKLLLQQLNAMTPFRGYIEKRMRDVKVLVRNDKPLKLVKSAPNTETRYQLMGEGKVTIKNKPLSTVASLLQHWLHIPVIDETELEGNYDIVEDITWYAEAPEQIHVELDKRGLKLIDAKREIEMLIIVDESNTANE